MKLKNSFILLCGCALSAEAELKDDKSLYDLAPADAAYVRVVNTTHSPYTLTIGSKQLNADADCDVSPVQWIASGTPLPGGVLSTPARLYTYWVSSSDDDWLITDIEVNPLKAYLSLVNLSQTHSMSLFTTEGNRSVFKDVEPGQMVQRALNPLTVSLSAEADEKRHDLDPVSLQRGRVTEAIVCESEGLLQHTVSTY